MTRAVTLRKPEIDSALPHEALGPCNLQRIALLWLRPKPCVRTGLGICSNQSRIVTATRGDLIYGKFAASQRKRACSLRS
jgi:hypothetical protein